MMPIAHRDPHKIQWQQPHRKKRHANEVSFWVFWSVPACLEADARDHVSQTTHALENAKDK